MKCEYGLCLVCEKDLMSTCGSCGHKKPGNEYTEVQLDLTNGSRMAIAVCHGCKDKVHLEDKKQIMHHVRQGWHKEHDKMNWTKEKRDHYWASHGEGVLEIA